MRADVLSLSSEALARLTNKGLLKRAERDIAEGNGPTVTVVSEAIRAEFSDGTVSELVADRSVEDANCTCGAKGWCRHRVAMILACQSMVPKETEKWSPGGFTDENLISYLGAKLVSDARQLLGDRMVIRLDTQTKVPTARLPTCSVSFLSNQSLQYARCSCARTRCEHIVLAVWAFRETINQSQSEVILGDSKKAIPHSLDINLFDEIEATCISLANEGAVNIPLHLVIRINESIRRCQDAGWCWMQHALQALHEQIDAWSKRHAIYQPGVVSSLICEIVARARVARGGDDQLASEVLGLGVPMMTKLARTTLTGLGARVIVRDNHAHVRVYLADGASGDVVFLEDHHDVDAQRPVTWKSRKAAPGVLMGSLATGSTISDGVRRHADHSLALLDKKGATQTGQLAADWVSLCQRHQHLSVRNARAFAKSIMDSPPHWLLPRDGARDMRILWVSDVGEPTFDPSSQELLCPLVDEERSTTVLLKYAHQPYMPRSVDAIARLLKNRENPIRAIAGLLRLGSHGLEIEPCSIDNGSMHLAADTADVPQVALPHAIGPHESGDPLQLIESCLTLLDRLHHQGLNTINRTDEAEIARMFSMLGKTGYARLASLLYGLSIERSALMDKGRASIECRWLAELMRDDNRYSNI
jgi:hypothetical protein